MTLSRLMGCHPDLIRVIEKAATMSGKPFVVTEGLRSRERQEKLVAEGKSQTMHSRHLTGHACDLAIIQGGKAVWDWKSYEVLAGDVKAAAALLKVPIEWGGDWKTLKDGPHFQLPHKEYPA